jgi:cytochrome c peroxidase
VDNVFIPKINLIPNNDCQNPIGAVTPNDTSKLQKMYVNCWVSRKAAVVDLGKQKLVNTIASAAAPVGLEAQINRGRRFYFTGTGRWSNEVWSSCGSCHPDGLSDNITWRFGAGPRQSIDMSNTFSHGPGVPLQRILNWSAEREEISDFERNTRGVSGGVGAIVSSEVLDAASRLCLNPDPNQCDVSNQADPNKDFNGLKVQLGKPVQEIQDGIGGSPPSAKKDWDDIAQFSKTIRPLKGRRFLNAASVSRGRAIFSDPKLGNCATCHSGPLWTLSRLFFTPADQTNKDLTNLDFTGPGHTKMIQAELTGQPGVVIAPAQVACVLRNLKTFGIPGDPAATDALEKKGVAGFPRAQGEFSGFNIPGLFGLQAGAPFLHHGQAKNLQELFGAPWNHQLAGNPVFTPSGQQLEDLSNFLLSIDANTPPEDVPAGADKCPAHFP